MMGNDEMAIAAVLVLALIVLTAVRIKGPFIRFNWDIRRFTRHMRNICVRTFYQPCLIKKEQRISGSHHILIPSVTGMCVCAVCLCGVSWAWFTDSSRASVAEVRSAYYSVNVNVVDKDKKKEVVTKNENGAYPLTLEENNVYEVTINASGTANYGYCEVKVGSGDSEKIWYTPQIAPQNNFKFVVRTGAFDKVKAPTLEMNITPSWGTRHSNGEGEELTSGQILKFGSKAKAAKAALTTASPVVVTLDGILVTNQSQNVSYDNGAYNIQLAGGQHSISLAVVDEDEENVYCVIRAGEEVYYTPQIMQDRSFEFKVEAKGDIRLTITPVRGELPADAAVFSAETPLVLGTETEGNTAPAEENMANPAPDVISEPAKTESPVETAAAEEPETVTEVPETASEATGTEPPAETAAAEEPETVTEVPETAPVVPETSAESAPEAAGTEAPAEIAAAKAPETVPAATTESAPAEEQTE